MKSPEEIGEILKMARKKKGLTIEKVYKATRIQPSVIEAMENGKADEILSKVYVLLFLRKYASFLGLGGDNLAANYKSIYTEEKEGIRDMVMKKPVTLNLDMRKWASPVVSIVFIVIFVGLLFAIKSKSPPSQKAIIKERAQVIFPIPKNKPIELVLRATDDVWMKAEEDGKTIFEGTLRKNTEKEWLADNKIELWVGRAEALNLTINGKPLGKIGKGKIRTIQISRSGLKIGNKWLLRAKK